MMSKTGGATTLERLTVTVVTKLAAGWRGSEHVKDSSASQTTGLLFTSVPSLSGLQRND